MDASIGSSNVCVMPHQVLRWHLNRERPNYSFSAPKEHTQNKSANQSALLAQTTKLPALNPTTLSPGLTRLPAVTPAALPPELNRFPAMSTALSPGLTRLPVMTPTELSLGLTRLPAVTSTALSTQLTTVPAVTTKTLSSQLTTIPVVTPVTEHAIYSDKSSQSMFLLPPIEREEPQLELSNDVKEEPLSETDEEASSDDSEEEWLPPKAISSKAVEPFKSLKAVEQSTSSKAVEQSTSSKAVEQSTRFQSSHIPRNVLKGKMERSKATERNTEWGVRLFKEWCSEVQETVDFETIGKIELSKILLRFYAEARPQRAQLVAGISPEMSEYNNKSLQNIRAALNRHLDDLDRGIDLVKDLVFSACNLLLKKKGKWINSMQVGDVTSRSKAKNSLIDDSDLELMYSYLKLDMPVNLRLRVFYLIISNYQLKGFHILELFKMNYFNFGEEKDVPYFQLTTESAQILSTDKSASNLAKRLLTNRIYATGDPGCPVSALQKFKKRTHPDAEYLFNSYINQNTLNDPPPHEMYWYSPKHLSGRSWGNLFKDIVSQGKKSSYVTQNLRFTSKTAIDEKWPLHKRQLLFLSGIPGQKKLDVSDSSLEGNSQSVLCGNASQLSNIIPVLPRPSVSTIQHVGIPLNISAQLPVNINQSYQTNAPLLFIQRPPTSATTSSPIIILQSPQQIQLPPTAESQVGRSLKRSEDSDNQGKRAKRFKSIRPNQY